MRKLLKPAKGQEYADLLVSLDVEDDVPDDEPIPLVRYYFGERKKKGKKKKDKTADGEAATPT